MSMSNVSRHPLVTGCSIVAALLVSITAVPTQAETVATINGVNIDSSLVDFYVESRTQKPAAQATADERNAVLEELKDIYRLSTQPIAATLAKSPRLQAQLELQERGALAQAVASNFLENNQATDAEIAAMYEEQIKLSPQLQFKARHILVETQGAANDLIAKLNEGADFEALAKESSTGPSGPSGGDLGWFTSDQMVPPFSQAVASMEDGNFTKTPVQTQFGWHVILREGSRPAEPPPLDSVRDVLKQQVEQTKFQKYLDGLSGAE